MESTQKKYKILVSNDDGIDAPGVLSIVEEVKRFTHPRIASHFR